MLDNREDADHRSPQPGDIILYGRTTDGKGAVIEVPAIILEVEDAGHSDSRVSLKTFEIGHEMEPRREVRFSQGPRHGCWRWRPDR